MFNRPPITPAALLASLAALMPFVAAAKEPITRTLMGKDFYIEIISKASLDKGCNSILAMIEGMKVACGLMQVPNGSTFPQTMNQVGTYYKNKVILRASDLATPESLKCPQGYLTAYGLEHQESSNLNRPAFIAGAVAGALVLAALILLAAALIITGIRCCKKKKSVDTHEASGMELGSLRPGSPYRP